MTGVSAVRSTRVGHRDDSVRLILLVLAVFALALCVVYWGWVRAGHYPVIWSLVADHVLAPLVTAGAGVVGIVIARRPPDRPPVRLLGMGAVLLGLGVSAGTLAPALLLLGPNRIDAVLYAITVRFFPLGGLLVGVAWLVRFSALFPRRLTPARLSRRPGCAIVGLATLQRWSLRPGVAWGVPVVVTLPLYAEALWRAPETALGGYVLAVAVPLGLVVAALNLRVGYRDAHGHRRRRVGWIFAGVLAAALGFALGSVLGLLVLAVGWAPVSATGRPIPAAYLMAIYPTDVGLLTLFACLFVALVRRPAPESVWAGAAALD